MSQINNTAQIPSHHKRYHHTRDKDHRAHHLLQLTHPLRREEIRGSTPRPKTRRSIVLPRGGMGRSVRHRQILLRVARLRGKTPRSILRLLMIKDDRRLFPKYILLMIRVDMSGKEARTGNVEESQTLITMRHSPGKRSCILHSPPPSFVPPSTIPNEQVPRATQRPRNLPLCAVRLTDREYRLMAP